MASPLRSSVSAPIKEFIFTPSVDTMDVVNALVSDLNQYISLLILGLPQLTYTVATAPASAPNDTEAWFSDGRKIGEESSQGTGIWAYYSAGAWRRFSLDNAVSAAALQNIITEGGVNILTEAGGTITTGG